MPVTAKRDTGHAATVAFGTTSWAGMLVGINGVAITRDPVDVTTLSTSGPREMIAGDVETVGPMVLQVGFATATGLPSTTTTNETITLTFPLAPGGGGATGATLAGTGLITGIKYPDMQTGQATQAEITVQWDGFTGPTWTAEA